MKHILCSLLVATLPFGSVLADAPKSKNAKVTLVYQHELPNVPGKSIKGVLVEYGPGGGSPGHTHPKSAFIYATVLEGAIRSQINDGPVTVYKAGQSFSELPGDRHAVSSRCYDLHYARALWRTPFLTFVPKPIEGVNHIHNRALFSYPTPHPE